MCRSWPDDAIHHLSVGIQCDAGGASGVPSVQRYISHGHGSRAQSETRYYCFVLVGGLTDPVTMSSLVKGIMPSSSMMSLSPASAARP